jgi:predicted nucleotidyltransferase
MWVRDGVEMDLVTHDLRKFVRLMLRRNGYVLEQLLSPLVVHTADAHRELAALAPASSPAITPVTTDPPRSG